MLILLVDDDHEDYQIFSEGLKAAFSREIKCLHAVDGHQAVETLRELVVLPDYIFLDINMPVMDGKSCLLVLKNDPVLSGIPVIIYSTTSNAGEIENFKALGAADFVVKPQSFTKLVSVLRSLLLPAA